MEWDDGYAGIVDLRPVIAHGKIFAYLQDAQNFRNVQIGEFGHAIYWLNERGEEVDFGADSLRQRSERQADLHLSAG